MFERDGIQWLVSTRQISMCVWGGGCYFAQPKNQSPKSTMRVETNK